MITKTEKDIMELCIEGLTNLQIAKKLNFSIYTIKNHKTKIREVLEAKNMVQAMAIYILTQRTWNLFYMSYNKVRNKKVLQKQQKERG